MTESKHGSGPHESDAATALHEAAALLLARSNNTEDAMGEFVPQAIYDSLFERNLLRLASDITGESWATTTDAGDDYLRALLVGGDCVAA